MKQRAFLSALAAAGLALGTLVTAGPAFAADGSVTENVCGATGTFKTINGVAQVQYISGKDGKANSQDNGGCFGIAPSGNIYWTPQSHPSWGTQIPGHGNAERDVTSSTFCGYQYVEVQKTNYYYQFYIPGYGWDGTWYSGLECSDVS